MMNSTPKAWEHQTRAAEFLRDKEGAMLAMEMGTGKSKCAIDHMEALDARLTLILAPLSVVDHVWPREIQRHGSRENITIIPLGTKAGTVREKMTKAAEGLRLATARKGPAIIIVNYESAYREPLGSFVKGIHWDLFVMDECHPAGTSIATPDGHRKVEDLREGDPVWGVDHLTGEIAGTRVTHTFRRRNTEELVEIGGARMTPEHPVWTTRGYIPAREIIPGDRTCRLEENGNAHAHPDLRMVPIPILGVRKNEKILRETVRWESVQPGPSGQAQAGQGKNPPAHLPTVLEPIHGGPAQAAVPQQELRHEGRDGNPISESPERGPTCGPSGPDRTCRKRHAATWHQDRTH